MSTENPFNQPPQAAPPEQEKTEPETLSLEELRAAQARKDAETVETKREQEAEEQHQKELQARAKEDIAPRESALAGLRSSQSEVDRLRAYHIEERIANSEKLRESQTAKEAELQKAQGEFGQIERQLTEIQSLMASREEREIAEEVKGAFKQAQGKKSEVEKILRELTQELETMKAESISDVQIQRYQKLLEGMGDLNAQVADIEANPYMIERLFAEAKAENEMRDNVVECAMWGVRRDPKETEIMSQVVQSFLTEEFEARGFNKIKDPKERERAMREVTQAVASQAGGGAESGPLSLAGLKRDEYVGVLLKNLVGKHGTMAGTAGFLGLASGDREFGGSPQNDAAVGDYIRQHLGTLNFLRASASGLTFSRDTILGQRFSKDSRRSFDQDMGRYELNAYEGSAIVSRDADKNTKDRAQAQFRKDMKAIQDWEKATIEQEKAQLNAEIFKVAAEAQELQVKLSEAKDANVFIEQALRGNIYSENEAQRRLAEVNNTIANLEPRRAQAEEELNELGALSFRRKKELRNEILRIDHELTGYNGEKDYLGKLVKSYKTGSPWKVEDELIKAQQNLIVKKNRLDYLNRVGA